MFKQLHYFKSWLLLMLCMVVGVGSAWAQETTLWSEDFSSYSANDVPSGGTYSYVCVNGASNTKIYNENLAGGTAPELLINKNGGSFTATVPLDNIEGDLTLKFYTNNQQINVSTTTEGISGGVQKEKIQGEHTVIFTGVTTSMTQIVITFSSNSSNVRLDNIVLKGTQVNPSDTRTETSVTIDDSGITNTDVYTSTTAGSLSATVMAGAATVTGASVTWSSDNDAVATVDASTGAVTLVGAGTVNITAAYEGDTDYKPSTNTYELTVIDSNAPGTVNNPYTVAQAIDNTPSSGTTANVYIKGIVSQFFGADITDDNYHRYYISDDGTTSTQLLVFGGKGLNDVAFSSADDLLLGDEVVIVGQLKTYSNAPEVAGDNYIVTLNRKPAPTIKLVDEDETEVEDELNVQFDGQKGLDVYCFANDVDITNDVEITWTSADETIATYDGAFVNGLAMGTTTITFNFAGNADYRPVSKVLTVNVEDARTPVTLTFGEVPSSINVGETASYPIEEGYSVTYTSSDDNIVSVDEDGEITANAVGTATITATFDGDEMFQPASASYTITVVDPNAPSVVYEKVTSTADITDGEYLIVYAGDATHSSVAFNSALETLDAANNGVAVTITDDKIESSADVDAATFTITAVTNGYTIVSSSGKYIDKTANSNGLDAKDTEMVNSSITIDESGNVVITASGGCTLRYNYASDNLRFRYYKSGQQAIALYKKVTGTPETVSVTITSAGAASFSSKYALDFSNVEGLKAYKATSKSDSYVHLDEVEQVPARAGVIVKGAEGTYNVPVATGDVAELEGNLLVGTGENTFTVTSAEYGKVFKYVKTNAGVVGFQKAKVDWICQAGHAYLMLSETQAREFIGIFGEDIATGIEAIDNSQWTIDNDAPAYNLAGQKVGKGYKGIVVKNGKKYVK